MRGTRPLDNEEIRQVAEEFRAFSTKNHALRQFWFESAVLQCV